MTCQVKQRHQNSSVISNARGSSYPPIYAKKWEKKIVELTSSNVKTNIEKSREIRRIILFTAETFCIMCHMESIWFMVFEEVLYDTFFGRFYFIFQMKDYNIISVPLCVCVCVCLRCRRFDGTWISFFFRQKGTNNGMEFGHCKSHRNNVQPKNVCLADMKNEMNKFPESNNSVLIK